MNRPWGGGHARASSPEPGGGGMTPGTAGAEPHEKSSERDSTSKDDVIVQLEKEVQDMRNLLQQKDQKIQELSRTDMPHARWKKDMRNMAAELRNSRKQVKELQARGAGGDAEGMSSDISAAGAAAAAAALERDNRELEARLASRDDENRQLRNTVEQLQLQVQSQEQQLESLRLGAASQRAVEQTPAQLTAAALARHTSNGSAGGISRPAPYPMAVAPEMETPAPEESENLVTEMIVYSSHSAEHAASLGKVALQGFGTVDGAGPAAKVLLSRLTTSVFHQQQRPGSHIQGSHMGAPVMQGGMQAMQMQMQGMQMQGMQMSMQAGYPHGM